MRRGYESLAIVAAAAAVVAIGGCAPKRAFEAPARIEGDHVKIERTIEAELMEEVASMWKRLGLSESVQGAYEHEPVPYKPVFFFSAAKASGGDRRLVMEEALKIFGGSRGLDEAASEKTSGKVTFLCAQYQTTGFKGHANARGLNALSAICTWSDAKFVGFGVGTAGRGVDDVLPKTIDGRNQVIAQ